MRYTENALNISTIKSYKGIGNDWIVKNIKGNESVETIVGLLNSKIWEKTSVEIFEIKKNDNKTKLLQKLENYCDGIVAFGDDNFPKYRGIVSDSEKPVFIYYKGNIDLLSAENKNIAVIGLLNPEGNIEERERNLVTELVKNGATIVSGLARGCDGIAHQQTLDSNGKTVAILPSALSDILPKSNKELAQQIVEKGGLLITEYGNNSQNQWDLVKRYKDRDRLQALFSDAITLVASYSPDSAKRWAMGEQKLDSGARLAMRFAKNYRIPRAVMYDEEQDKKNPMFDLNRDIIKEKENVMIIEELDDISKIEEKISKTQKTQDFSTNQSELF